LLQKKNQELSAPETSASHCSAPQSRFAGIPVPVFALVVLLFMALIQGCLFEERTVNASSWLEDEGYKVQPGYSKFVLEDAAFAEIGTGLDSTPYFTPSNLMIGAQRDLDVYSFFRLNLHQDLQQVFEGDSAKLLLNLYLDSAFYTSDYVELDWPQDDSASLRLFWDIESFSTSDSLDEAQSDNADSTWGLFMRELTSEEPLTISSAFKNCDNGRCLQIVLPDTLQTLIQDLVEGYGDDNFAARLHLAVTAADTMDPVRFEGINDSPSPRFLATYVPQGDTVENELFLSIYRTALAGWVDPARRETLYGADNLVLHAGIRESLYFTIPDSLITNLLEEEYGEQLSEGALYSDLVVLSAVVKIKVADGDGFSELGHSIPVYVYAEIDSVSSDYAGDRYIEARALDSLDIVENAQANLLFAGRDSLFLQHTHAFRYLVNTAGLEDLNARMYWKMGAPVLRPNDPRISNYYEDDESGISTLMRVNSEWNDFSAWDLGPADDLRFDLELNIMDFFSEEAQ